MRFIITALALVAGVCHAVITIPNVGDGVWTIDVTTGEPVKVAELNITAASSNSLALSAKFRRQTQLPNPQTNCNGYAINPDDLDCAWNAFNNWIASDGSVGTESDHWTSCNSAVAYMCNYGWTQNAVIAEYAASMYLEDAACGSGGAGWVYIGDWAKAYGRASVGNQICF
jgi:hypothetical protein